MPRDRIEARAPALSPFLGVTGHSTVMGGGPQGNREVAVQALLKISEVPLNPNGLRDGLNVFQGLATNTQPTGYIDPQAMQQTLDLLKQYGGVKTDQPATTCYTNEFVKKA